MSRILGRRDRREAGPAHSASFFVDWTGEDDSATGARRARTFLDIDFSTRRQAIERAERRSDRWLRTARLRRGGLVVGLSAAGIATAAIALHTSSATADPSAHTWYRLRMCESSNNYAINTGNGYYGAYQFDLATWRSVGGSGYPNQASAAEQDARALILYRERGWQPWTCAGILGLRADADARSGRISDIHPGGGSAGTGSHPGSHAGPPAFPGSRIYQYGDWNDVIKQFQDQMHKRGYFPVGTGQYGPNTLAMVKQLQRLNGLIPNGELGPNTWRLAWTGKYSTPTSTPAPPSTPAPTSAPPSTHHRRHPAHTAPAFPGKRWYHLGDWNNTVKQFQDQMHKRGYFPAGSGEYGPLTLAMIKQLQRLNGLIPNGELGPHTWALAWTGRYHPATTAPAFPGKRWYHYGDWNNTIKRFQDQMHKRGYFPVGTGQYGPNTLAMVKQLQRLNGLVPNGELGPNTWSLAWLGSYHRP